MKETNFPGCGKLFASMDITAVRRANLFLAKSESKGTELSGVVNLLEVDIMIVMESFIVMSVYQLQIVVNVIKSLSDVHPYLSHISVLKRSVSQHRYLYTYQFTSLCNFFLLFHICCKQMQR